MVLCCCAMLKLTMSETAENEGAKAGSLALGFTPLKLLGRTEARSHSPEVLEFFSLKDLLIRLRCL